jgi:hypothetical protein
MGRKSNPVNKNWVFPMSPSLFHVALHIIAHLSRLWMLLGLRLKTHRNFDNSDFSEDFNTKFV